MALNPFMKPEPRGDGTVFGVPFAYSMETDEYVLPDGNRIARYSEMVDYVMRNLRSFQSDLGRQYGRLKNPEELNQKRLFIINENKKRQLKWDKEFNRKVVELMRRAIENADAGYSGVTKVNVIKRIPFTIETYGKDSATMVQPVHEEFEVRYESWLPQSEAYARCREQAEYAIRCSLPPPDLLPMV